MMVNKFLIDDDITANKFNLLWGNIDKSLVIKSKNIELNSKCFKSPEAIREYFPKAINISPPLHAK